MIISICSHKGGVSKTQSSLNIAHALALYKKKVLLVDLDIQLNLTRMFPDIAPKQTLYDLLKSENPTPTNECIVATPIPNVSILPNSVKLGMLENEILHSFGKGSFNRMKERLRETAEERFDYTLIDHPASLGVLPLTAVIASDQVLIPVNTGSNFSIEGLHEALNFVDEARKNFNPNLKPAKLILAMIKKRGIAHQTNLEAIERRFEPHHLCRTKIPAAAAMETAEMNKQTIFQLKRSTPVAKAFMALSKEIMEF